MLKIAICDDDEAEVKLIKEYANMYSVQNDNQLTCTGFHSGEELLSNYHKGDLDLILLDVMIPGIDGFSLIEEINFPTSGNAQEFDVVGDTKKFGKDELRKVCKMNFKNYDKAIKE